MSNPFQWQYPAKVEPFDTSETPGLKWYVPLSEPVLPPEELLEYVYLNTEPFVPETSVSSKWYVPLSDPPLPPEQLAEHQLINLEPFVFETSTMDKWFMPLSAQPPPLEDIVEHPSDSSPVFTDLGLENWRPTYPNFIHDAIPPTHQLFEINISPIPETVPGDWWAPEVDLPTPPAAPEYYLYPSVFIDPDFSSVPGEVPTTGGIKPIGTIKAIDPLWGD